MSGKEQYPSSAPLVGSLEDTFISDRLRATAAGFEMYAKAKDIRSRFGKVLRSAVVVLLMTGPIGAAAYPTAYTWLLNGLREHRAKR